MTVALRNSTLDFFFAKRISAVKFRNRGKFVLVNDSFDVIKMRSFSEIVDDFNRKSFGKTYFFVSDLSNWFSSFI